MIKKKAASRTRLLVLNKKYIKNNYILNIYSNFTLKSTIYCL